MRPPSIVNFSRFYLAAVAIWLINLATGWNRTIATFAENPQFKAQPEMLQIIPTFMAGFSAFVLLLSLLMWWLAAHRRSGFAKWVLVVFYAFATLSVPFIFIGWSTNGALASVLALASWILQTAAIVMLFRKDSNEWFGVDSDPAADGPVVPPPQGPIA